MLFRSILKQQEALHQALGNLPPFVLGPCPYASEHGQRHIFELAGDLPPHLGSRGGCHIRPDLDNWLGITNWLPDHDPARCPRRGPRGSVTWDPGQLIDEVLLLFGVANKRRMRSPVLAIGLLRLGRGSISLSHHLFILIYPYS